MSNLSLGDNSDPRANRFEIILMVEPEDPDHPPQLPSNRRRI